LGLVLNANVVLRTVAEKIPHRISAIANNNKAIAYSGVAQSFDDVLEDRFSVHLDHRLRKICGELAHASATARCENYGFLDHHDESASPKTILIFKT
jgi:hypothetical protein